MDLATKFSLLVFVPIFAVSAWLWWMAGQVERRIEAARSWPRAPGTVTSARIGRSKNTYWPEVRYDYRVEGRSYQGKRLGFVQPSRTKAECEAILQTYTPGTRIQAWYDPAKPSFAVLDAGGDGKVVRMAALMTGAAALLSLVVTYISLRQAG